MCKYVFISSFHKIKTEVLKKKKKYKKAKIISL